MWMPIEENPPADTEVLLWLKADVGCEEPIGRVIARYQKTPMGEMWCQKVVGDGILNTGIRADLITHYCLLEGETPDERPIA